MSVNSKWQDKFQREYRRRTVVSLQRSNNLICASANKLVKWPAVKKRRVDANAFFRKRMLVTPLRSSRRLVVGVGFSTPVKIFVCTVYLFRRPFN